MAGNPSDSAIVTAQAAPPASDDQHQLSQNVQTLIRQQLQLGNGGIDGQPVSHKADPNDALSRQFAPSAPARETRIAVPTSTWDKFADVTVAGIEKIPEGIVHSLQNGKGLAENAVLSVGLGAAAKLILPETGVAGKLFAIGLGAYFAEQTAVPVYKAYKTGLNAKSMRDIHSAGDQLGDALGGLTVNLPIGILGYKVGGGIAGAFKSAPGVAGAETATGAAGAEAPPAKLEGRVEVTEKPEVVTDKAAGTIPTLPERYQSIQEDFSGTKVPGISREFLKNLTTDDTGTYYGAGLHYPDIMADPEMAQYLKDQNALTMSKIDPAVYQQELALEAKASSYTLPADWQNAQAPQHAIDVTDGGDGSMRVGSKTYQLTDDGAPNRKLVVRDGIGRETTLIPEAKDIELQQVIQGTANGADHFAVVGSQHGASVLNVYDASGKLTSAVPLEGFGTLHDVRQGASPSELKFVYDTPISHPRVLTLDMASGKATLSPHSADVFNTDDYVTDKLLVPWADRLGNPQQSPVFISRPKNLQFNGENPSYYKIYGGFDVGPQYVGYSPSSASWLMRGAVAVDPVLPGDGGLGSGNFEEGLGANIENTDLALAAIIQKLHDMGISSPSKTGIYGRSNGGTVLNNMLNQRPTMVGAAVTESGVNSLFDSPVVNVDTGSSWTSEFGDPNNPDNVSWMAKLDALNNLARNKTLPPTLAMIGTIDGVVNPGNGITYASMRQALGNGEALLYSRFGEGHDPVNLNLAIQTAFLWDRLRPKS